jgi:hypothetical protein
MTIKNMASGSQEIISMSDLRSYAEKNFNKSK